jgi:signal transduction histidine kinase
MCRQRSPLPENHPEFGLFAAGNHQRHPGFFQDRSRQVRTERTYVPAQRSLRPGHGSVRHQGAEKGIELLVDIDAETPKTIQGDPLRLQQILTNLISNAIKFTDSGA